jgi:deoxyribonuclease V
MSRLKSPAKEETLIGRWPGDIREAMAVQETLRKRVRLIHLQKTPEYVAGVDAAFGGDRVVCVSSLFRFPALEHIEDVYTITDVKFPYIPGFLSFREGPAIIMTIRKLSIRPDVLLFDGQGIAHPYGLGIASHIGVLLNIPSIGCAKSRLIGDHTEPDRRKGMFSYLTYRGKRIGAVLRTRDGVKPVFVSPGHLIELEEAIDIVLRCTDRYRLPEPVRRADIVSKRLRNELLSS